VVLAARRARNLDTGFQIVANPLVAEASLRMGYRILGWSLVLGLVFAGLVAAIPL